MEMSESHIVVDDKYIKPMNFPLFRKFIDQTNVVNYSVLKHSDLDLICKAIHQNFSVVW